VPGTPIGPGGEEAAAIEAELDAVADRELVDAGGAPATAPMGLKRRPPTGPTRRPR
jgi:hypothetical protein